LLDAKPHSGVRIPKIPQAPRPGDDRVDKILDLPAAAAARNMTAPRLSIANDALGVFRGVWGRE
jgi:hypothetical protein